MSPGSYIAGVPIMGRECRNVYRWCAHSRIRVQECMSLERSLWNAIPEVYNFSVPTVESEFRDVYRWCAHWRIQVEGCISLVLPL